MNFSHLNNQKKLNVAKQLPISWEKPKYHDSQRSIRCWYINQLSTRCYCFSVVAVRKNISSKIHFVAHFLFLYQVRAISLTFCLVFWKIEPQFPNKHISYECNFCNLCINELRCSAIALSHVEPSLPVILTFRQPYVCWGMCCCALLVSLFHKQSEYWSFGCDRDTNSWWCVNGGVCPPVSCSGIETSVGMSRKEHPSHYFLHIFFTRRVTLVICVSLYDGRIFDIRMKFCIEMIGDDNNNNNNNDHTKCIRTNEFFPIIIRTWSSLVRPVDYCTGGIMTATTGRNSWLSQLVYHLTIQHKSNIWEPNVDYFCSLCLFPKDTWDFVTRKHTVPYRRFELAESTRRNISVDSKYRSRGGSMAIRPVRFRLSTPIANGGR